MIERMYNLLVILFLAFVAFSVVLAFTVAEDKGVVVVGLFLGAFLGLHFTVQHNLGAALFIAVVLSVIAATLLGTFSLYVALTVLVGGVVVVFGRQLFYEWGFRNSPIKRR